MKTPTDFWIDLQVLLEARDDLANASSRAKSKAGNDLLALQKASSAYADKLKKFRKRWKDVIETGCSFGKEGD